MKIVAITGERRAEVVERPDPKAFDDFVVVKITVAPMCTEYKAFERGQPSEHLGHESAGEVVEVARPGRVKVGDRVVVMPTYPCGVCPLCLAGEYIHCQSGPKVGELAGSDYGFSTYAQYTLKQDWMLVPIPDDVSDEHASMACCGLGPTFGAMQRMAVDAFDTVLVTGLGPVGLGGVVNGVSRGARVIAVESQPYRARLAREIGAAEVLDPTVDNVLEAILDLTGGVGVDKALDCSGVPAAQQFMIQAVRRRGQAAFVGEGGEVSVHVSRDMIRKGLTLHGSWHYSMADTPRIMQVIRGRPDLLGKQITHSFPMSRVQEAFELQLTRECGKVLLCPWE